jgi:hypothetical protein
VPPALITDTQHDHARTASRRVRAYIGEVQVQRDQRSLFPVATLGNHLIGRTAQAFVKHRVNVVPRRDEKRCCLVVQILVDLQSHRA